MMQARQINSRRAGRAAGRIRPTISATNTTVAVMLNSPNTPRKYISGVVPAIGRHSSPKASARAMIGRADKAGRCISQRPSNSVQLIADIVGPSIKSIESTTPVKMRGA